MLLRSVITVVVSTVMLFATTAFAQGWIEEPAKALAPQIADYVVVHGKPAKFNVGTSDAGTSFSVRFFTDREIYIVSVNMYENGKKTFRIDYYLTNQHFADYANPADSVAEELIMGIPKIISEEHLSDRDADGALEMYQQFFKKRGPVFEGFTRAERDLGKRAGVAQFLLDGGQVLRADGKWRKATEQEIREARLGYLNHLKTIARKFGR